MKHSELIDANEAAKILQVNPTTVRRWCHDKKIPHVKFPSGRIKFYREDIEAMLIPKFRPSESAAAVSHELSGQESSDLPLPGFDVE